MQTELFITVNHLDDFGGYTRFRVGDELELEKDEDNPYDDEAIIVYKDGVKCGYIANSVCSVARGTYSAGRIYEQVKKNATCIVRFITEDIVIAQLK